jgi:hypothetical protein
LLEGKGKGKEKGETGGEVFLTPEEMLQAEKDRDEEKRRQLLAKERRMTERELDEARKREDARLAGELGRELGRKAVKAKVDHRNYAVRSIRSAKQVGRDLNKEVMADSVKGAEGMEGFLTDDERWLRNYSIHSVKRGVNVSCSFNPRSGLCYTCLGEPHRAWESDGVPVAVVLADQSFPANVPSADGGECLRVMRVEDGSLHELTSELLQVLKRNMVIPGMVIMLGSLSQLGKCGEWIKNRNLLLPFVSVSGVGSHTLRSLLEFLNWVDNLQDPEMELLRGVRRQYVAEFLSPVEGGQQWAGERQNMMLPISLYGEGVMLYKSREWGPLPRELRPVSEDEEAEWLGKLSTAMGREVNISLATTVASGRTLSAVRSLEEDGGQMIYKVASDSNAARTVVALTRKGVAAEKFGQRGWSLSVEKDVQELVSALKDADMSKQVLVFHCMDNGSFFSMDRCGGSSLPKKKNNAYHITGKLVVASGYALELMVEQMAHIVKEGKVGTAVVITPMPRYLDPCCIEHGAGKTEDQLEEERGKLLKAVWNLKREVFQLLAKLHWRGLCRDACRDPGNLNRLASPLGRAPLLLIRRTWV